MIYADEDGVLVLSRHAEGRCLERGISERRLRETVIYGVCVERNEELAIYEHRRIRVVMQGTVIVTVFRLPRKNPKRQSRAKAAKQTRLRHRLAHELGRRAVPK